LKINIHSVPELGKLPLIIIFILASASAFAQDNDGNPQDQDSTRTNKSLSNVLMQDPGSIVHKYTYDPVLERYLYTEKSGDVNISYPLSLSPEEFEERVMEEQMKRYFKQKADAVNGRNQSADEQSQKLLPIFYVNNTFFQSIFGGNQIEVIPQGSVAVDLGVLFTKQDNPALSPRNRTNLTFDFDQRISLSLLGKVGKRLKINVNYDTESTFDFQNQIKMEYTPTEDDIVRKIEVGNVSMPLNSSLIKGSQSLFGVKTQLQFGKTTITGVFAEQNSERKTVNVQGGGAVREFDKFILDYDQNRHFFLSQYFRDEYNKSLQNYPFINSNIQITRVQVWATNRSNSPQNLTDARNIVAIQDLGESTPRKIGVLLDEEGNLINPPAFSGFLNSAPNSFPDNANNDFNPLGINGPQQSTLTPAIRDIATIQQGFGANSSDVNEGVDYAKLENARQLDQGEFELYPQLGYISLNQRITNDEVLAVAFQYTVNGQVYQVGEFANDGVQATQQGQNPNPEGDPVAISQNLIVKMLKSPITNVNEPIWDLMMKNIYNLDAYQIEPEDFRFNLLYSDPQPLNYISATGSTPLPDDVEKTNLLRVFGLDQLNVNQDPIIGGDGFFDYVPSITVDPENGRIIFTKVEPFGEYLFDKLDLTPNTGDEDYEDIGTYNDNQEKYVFKTLYETTKIQASQEEADKNKFRLSGTYKSSGQEGIPIGAFNVPRGSVTVTAGGRELQEGVDYTVDYQRGRVKIINEALKASDTPIQVSTESNSNFGQQTKRFTGLNIQHQIDENFVIGGTFLNLNERPLTQKANYSTEPINNSIYGFNLNYSTEVPFFTRLVNKLPNLDTDVESNLSVRGEFAYLHPGSPKGNNFNGEATSYIDDFEASQTSISILSPLSWNLSSAPIGFGGELANGDLATNYRRAKLNWYNIDPVFYSAQRPAGISQNDLSQYDTRRVFIDEIFPNRDLVQGQTQAIYTMDLSFYPNERGMYNFNPASTGSNNLPNPEENFGGITRQINTTNFEQSNVEFIQFWVMDPFIYQENNNVSDGRITFNLGSISEDVLKDGRKQYENGLPEAGGPGNTFQTSFGRVPSAQSLVYAFDTDGQQRNNQDIGLDGLTNINEADLYSNFSGLEDPARDDYEYYLAAEGGVVERYRFYNGVQGNSPTQVGQNNRGNTTFPSVEDVNRDNTMNTINSYFEYEVPVYPNMGVDNNTSSVAGVDQDYITDVKELTTTLQNGQEMDVRWIQYKIPLNTSSENSVGGIADLRSVRFMRMFLSDFNEHVVLRLGTLDLIRGDYRRYTQAVEPNGSDPENTAGTTYEVTAVSQEQTSDYITPPGVVRERLVNNNQTVREDEQALSFKVNDLSPNDSRAVFKNFQVDMRQYKNLQMFLHAESLPSPNPELLDGELTAFIRIGTDFTDNYYQIEVPLSVSDGNSSNPRDVWPEENDLSIPFELLQQVKSRVIGNNNFNQADLNYFTEDLTYVPGTTNEGQRLVGIKGNPSFGNVRVIMIGLKNTGPTDVSGEVWFNELRMSDLKNQGGWAAVLNMDTNFADFANISATGSRSTIGFGSIEQGPNQRSREDIQKYNVVSNFNLGLMLPQNWGVKVPFSYSRGEELITPKYDPEYLDIELETLLDNTDDPNRRDELRERAEDYTLRQSVSLIGLRKERTGEAKPMFWDIENFAFSGNYNQVNHRDFKVERSLDQTVNTGATYNYSFAPVKVEPFKNISFLDSSDYYDPVQDFNFNLLPAKISASADINRQYNEQEYRQINLPPGSIGLPTLFQRNYRFDWQYTVNYNLTESLDVIFNSTDNRLVRNYIDENNFQDNSIGVFDDFFNTGQPNQHYQDLQVNYELPFDKLPVLEFVDATYSYTGTFQWNRGSQIRKTLENIPNLGNSVQNSQTHRINGTLNMSQLYNYIGLKKKGGNQKSRSRSRQGNNKLGFSRGDDNQNGNNQEEEGGLSFGDRLLNTGIDLLTVVDRLTINYEENQGTFLPGYTNDIGFAGTLKPRAGFTFGSQADVRQTAAQNGWLTLYQQFNEQYTETETKSLNFQARLDLLPDLSVDLNANRIYSENYSENYRVSPQDLQYRSLNPRTFGNFNISTILIKTSFQTSDRNQSEAFNQFKENRITVARRLAQKAGIDLTNPNNINQETGYPKGFGSTSQQVVLPAFLAAYSGKEASQVDLGYFRDTPLPNWQIKYTGLMKLDWFRKTFERFSLQHGYSSTYNINQFQTNLDYNRSAPISNTNLNQAGNYKPESLISNINLVEQFSPLVKVDMQFKSSLKILAEVQKDRALSLSFDNNLLTETQGNEYRLGLGYRVKNVKFTSKIGGKSQVLSSDLNLKADLSFRRNKTIVRYLELNQSETTSGQDIWQINFTADYALSKNLTAIFYYDHSFSEYAISTAFPQTTIRSGFTLRYNFGN
jgi:cell surface protein SprA